MQGLISSGKCEICNHRIKVTDDFPYHLEKGSPAIKDTIYTVVCAKCFTEVMKPAMESCGVDWDAEEGSNCRMCGCEMIYAQELVNTYPHYLRIEQREEGQDWIIGMCYSCYNTRFKKAMKDHAIASDRTAAGAQQ